jgi:predicted O-methyltransferase YrrM
LIGQPARYLEVGSFEGRSLLWMMMNIFTHPRARAVAIDPCFTPFGDRLRRNLAISGVGPRVELVQGTSREKLWRLPRESFDVIMIDGSHLASDVLHDAVAAWELLKTGGVLIFDDYQLGTSHDAAFKRDIALELRPRAAIDAFVRINRRDLEVLVADYQVVVRKKPCFSSSYEACNYGNAQFCSALGAHLYYWDRRTLVTLPEVHAVTLGEEDARIVERSLLAGEDIAGNLRVQALLTRIRASAGSTGATFRASGEISALNAYRLVVREDRHFIVQNRAWAGAQSILYNGADFEIAQQAARSTANPVSFPSVFVGINHGRSVPGSNLPKRVRDVRRIATTWENNAGTVSGSYAAVCGISLSNRPEGDVGAPSGGNLRLWPGASGHEPPGTCVARDLVVNGEEGKWELWIGRDGEGSAISYVSPDQVARVAVDLNNFLLDALDRGKVAHSSYVSSVYAGLLIWSGGVGLQSRNFSVRVE